MIVCRDDIRPIYNCVDKLCKNALYEQRKNDIFNIGRRLGLKKIYNLNHDINNIDIAKLSTEISLNIIVGNMKEIYCFDNEILVNIASSINNKLKRNLYIFGYDNKKTDTIIKLRQDEYNIKRNLNNLMVGINSPQELIGLEDIEEFHKIGVINGS